MAKNRLSTERSGRDYIEQCRSEGVPIPDEVLSDEWTNHGLIQKTFVTGRFVSELWSWESNDPEGLCVALPRWSEADTATLFGIICMGRVSSKVCYFDNPTTHPDYEKFFAPRGKTIPIEKFIGGADLNLNDGGTCSDCHSGGNPYVVHPEEDAFVSLKASLSLVPARWPEPIVHRSWPQNPGPLTTLPPPSSGSGCDSCHSPSSGARFPIISSALPGYCGTVLQNALQRTMPPYGADPNLYTTHAQYLQSMCNNDPVYGPGLEGGVPVSNPPGDNVGFLSPPIVDSPIYACSTTVGVMGARLNSKVEVFVNGGTTPVATTTVRTPSYVSLTVPELQDGDVVTARQSVGGQRSASSNPVDVRDHRKDFPEGLPEPRIVPETVYECAHNIAVKHAKGATLHVRTSGSTPRKNWGSPKGYSVAQGDGPFRDNDELEVNQELCGDTSAFSAPVDADQAPRRMPRVMVDPDGAFESQELFTFTSIVHGATVDISESSAGSVGRIFSWPVTRYHEYDVAAGLGRPLGPGDRLLLQQSLCEESQPTEITTTKTCVDLEAPRIAPAREGEDFVIVTSYVPGATIRIYDSSGTEIGDGAGSIIQLSRSLRAGESIIVVQDLGENCIGKTGISVTVQDSEAVDEKGEK